MDLFILLGAGLLGAMFISGQSDTVRLSPLWKVLFGCLGGAIVYFLLDWQGKIPLDSSFSSLLLLFVLGGFAGGLAMLLFLLLKPYFDKR